MARFIPAILMAIVTCPGPATSSSSGDPVDAGAPAPLAQCLLGWWQGADEACAAACRTVANTECSAADCVSMEVVAFAQDASQSQYITVSRVARAFSLATASPHALDSWGVLDGGLSINGAAPSPARCSDSEMYDERFNLRYTRVEPAFANALGSPGELHQWRDSHY